MNTPDKIILIKTLQENNLPFPLNGTTVSIDGQDFVFKTAAGIIYKLPFAAQFSGLTDDAFEVKFSDGIQLTSKQLIDKAIDNLSENKEYITNHHVNNEQQNTVDHEKVITKTVYETVKILVHDNNSQDAGATPQDQDDGSAKDNIDNIDISPPEDVIYFSANTSATSTRNQTPDTPDTPDTPIIIPPAPKSPNISVLQLDTSIDEKDHTVDVGGGDRNTSSYDLQYGTKTVDLSNSNDNWTINAQIRGSADDENTLTKIIRLDDVTTITGISTSQNSDYSIISWDSDKGRELGLKQNEFAVVYSTEHDDSFSVNVNFAPPDYNGDTSYNLGFNISPDPLSINDAAGTTMLGTDPAPLIIKGGNGDDSIIAGRGDDIYDGGGGHNTIDYSQFNHGITVDFQASDSSTLESAGLKDTDSATVSGTDIKSQQVINNIQEVTGTRYDDVFITNASDHVFHGGDGNDTFIGYGGNNTFDGGSGNNTVDYRNVGGTTFDQVSLAKGLDVELNGVKVDLTNNVTGDNGWVDANGTEGKDQLSNIHTVYGTSYNDLIICDDNDNIIYGVDGDDVVVSGYGNNTVDGGKGTTTVDYSKINGVVDVNLNTGIANKDNGNKDNLTNVSAIIGSDDGGTLTGKTGASNTLIGTGGNTIFNLDGGTNTVFGGDGDNTYNISNSIVTVTADGNSNIGNYTNDMLTYHGSTSGKDTVSITGGRNSIFVGTGYSDLTFGGSSFNDVHTSNGGEVVYHGGDSYSELYLDDQTKTSLDYSGVDDDGFNADLNNGVIISNSGNFSDRILSGIIDSITGTTFGNGTYTASDYTTDLSVHAYGANNTISLGKGVTYSVLIDASASGVGGNNNVITTNGGENNNILINTSGSNNKITLDSKTVSNRIEITGVASNNTVYVYGGKHNSIVFDDSGINNTVDYSHTSGVLHIDLGAETASSNGNEGSDTLVGVNYIVANGASGSTFEAKEGVNTTFDLSNAKSAFITATNTGSDTIWSKSNTNKIDYSDLTNSLTFNINSTSKTTIKKSDSDTDTVNGYVGTYTGSNHGDNYTINAGSYSGLNINGGSGDDTFTVTNDYKGTAVVIDGGAGHDTFTYANNSNTYTTYVEFTKNTANGFNMTVCYNGYSATNSNGYMTVNDMNAFHLSDSGYNDLKWDAGINGINVTVDSHNPPSNPNVYTFDVNGGGNYINGGVKGLSTTSFSAVNYDTVSSMSSTSANINLNTGVVTFSDGRENDTLVNINRIEGTVNDDTITGHTTMSDIFSESNGNDTINGNSSSGNIYVTTGGGVNADLNAGTITKSNGETGVDHIQNIQELDLDKLSANSTVVAKDNSNMTFKLDSANVTYTITAAHSANDTYNITAGTLEMNYSDFSTNITDNLTDNTVIKGDDSKDTFSTHINNITTGTGDDIFTWSKFSDVSSVTINGGAGDNKLVESSNGDTSLTLGALSNVSNVETLDLSNVKHTSISFDVDGFFKAHTNESDFTIKIQNNDSSALHLSKSSAWTDTVSPDGKTDNWSDTSGHELHVVHVSAA
ncbi:calcium-binding protein [Erwinia endophytica]|uniref:beta strand repeat-containing protein n=1 Tax=Erwinia endophytica TaxID=1563158 RepID=UPI001265FBB0|nr:calcium-binding protein [Erwinia endophytica]KAB8312331.1 calcium-binding protein [Erwinia endophytica]